MNMRLNMPVRELEIAHGYYSEARMRALNEGRPVRTSVYRPSGAPAFDWRTGVRAEEDAIRCRYDLEV